MVELKAERTASWMVALLDVPTVAPKAGWSVVLMAVQLVVEWVDLKDNHLVEN